MQYPNDSRKCLTVLDQDSTLIAVIEMSLSSWLVAGIVPGIERPRGSARVPPLYPLTRAHEGRAGMSAVDSATRWGRLAAVADSMELGRSGRLIMRRRGAGRELPGHRQSAALKDQLAFLRKNRSGRKLPP